MKDFLSAARVQERLTCPCRVSFVEQTLSTNADLKALAQDGAPAGTVLIADRQTQGRGRMGRSFFSPSSTGLYLSLLLRPDYSAQESAFLTVIAAVAAVRAVKQVFDLSVDVKWVNDLFYEGRKVCGILTEASVNPADGRLEYAVCGIGFNVFAPEEGFPQELSTVAGALCSSPDESARVRLAAAFLNEFYEAMQEDRASILREYRNRSMLLGKTVTSPTGAFSGFAKVLGIDDSAGLILECSDGTRRVLSAGEVSVRLGE